MFPFTYMTVQGFWVGLWYMIVVWWYFLVILTYHLTEDERRLPALINCIRAVLSCECLFCFSFSQCLVVGL